MEKCRYCGQPAAISDICDDCYVEFVKDFDDDIVYYTDKWDM